MSRTGSPLSTEMYELMQQTLTISLLASGTPDPQTGVSGTTSTVPFLFTSGMAGDVPSPTRPCSLQPNLRKQRGGGGVVDGVAGSQATFICTTRWFIPPSLAAGQSLVLRVDGVYYPLYTQGALYDPAGQHITYEIGLEGPEGNR